MISTSFIQARAVALDGLPEASLTLLFFAGRVKTQTASQHSPPPLVLEPATSVTCRAAAAKHCCPVACTVSIRNNQALLLSMRVVVPWTMTLGCTARQALWLPA
jgi:hypothetical protein